LQHVRLVVGGSDLCDLEPACHSCHPEIGFLQSVAGDLRERAFLDLAAVIEHDAAIGDTLITPISCSMMTMVRPGMRPRTDRMPSIGWRVSSCVIPADGSSRRTRRGRLMSARLDPPPIDHRQAGCRRVDAGGKAPG
jgi:hypothetical protein